MLKTALVTPLTLQYIDGTTWVLLTNFVVISETLGTIVVPYGFKTDFNSIPRGLWNILPPDNWGEAGVVHDYLYRFGRLGTRPLTRLQCDTVHREFVHLKGCSRFKEWSMFWALRLGGWKPWNAYRAADPKP